MSSRNRLFLAPVGAFLALTPAVRAESELRLVPLVGAQTATGGPVAKGLPIVPTILVRGVLVDAQGAPLKARVLHVGSLDGRGSVVELRDNEILNPTGTTDAAGRFTVVVPVAFFAAAQSFTLGAVKAEPKVPAGAAQLSMTPVRRNGETASFAYKGKREAIDLGEVQLASEAE